MKGVIIFMLCMGEIEVNNGVVSLVFNSTTFSLKRLEKEDQGLEYYFAKEESPIWSCLFFDTSISHIDTSDLIEYTSFQAEAISYEITDSIGGKVLQLKWRKIVNPCSFLVYVRVFLPPSSCESYWHIKVNNLSHKYALFSIDFPYISPKPNYSFGTLNRLVSTTTKAGGIYDNPFSANSGATEKVKKTLGIDPDKKAACVLPSMQYTHLYDNEEERGLFFATLDSTAAYCKQFNIEGKGGYIKYFIRHYPENNHLPENQYSLPYDFFLTPIDGDWITGAKFYKNLVSNFSWLTIPKKKNISSHLIFWLRGVPYTGAVEYLMNYKRFFGEDLEILVTPGGDKTWSEYLVTGVLPENMRIFIEELIDSGFRVALCSKTNWWPEEDSINEEASFASTKTINNETYLDRQGEDTGFFMCSETEFWQEIYPFRITNTYTEYHCTDACLTNRPRSFLCYDSTHLHYNTLGGGKYALEGYQKMFSEIREATPQGGAILMEGKMEGMIPYIDAVPGKYYTEHSPNVSSYNAKILPYYSCVYHEEVTPVGSSENWAHYTGVLHFNYVNTLTFINGGILSIEFKDSLIKEITPEIDSAWGYVRLLTKYIAIGNSFLIYGSWERPPTLIGFVNETIVFPDSYPEKFRTVDTTCVLGGAFKFEEELALVFANYSTNKIGEGYTEIKLSDYGMGGEEYEVYEVDTLDTVLVDEFNDTTAYRMDLSLDPMSVKFFIIKEKTGIEEENIGKRVFQISPNPFRGKVEIKFISKRGEKIRIKIYNIAGGLVKILSNEGKKIGNSIIEWNGKDKRGKEVGSGIYFAKLEVNDNIEGNKKLILLR